MRYGIVSDIHANQQAFETVLSYLRNEVDVILHVGDIVGYGADPDVVISMIRDMGIRGVMGNHDSAVAGVHDPSDFNTYARRAVNWTRDVLGDDDIDFLKTLPYRIKYEDFLLVHSTPSKPEEWRYLLFVNQAAEEFNHFDERICFIGHSHVPMILYRDERTGRIHVWDGYEIEIEDDKRYIINVGSVGQPRDGDPRASFGIYDSDGKRFKLIRLTYDVKTASDRIIERGLPEFLAWRLILGK